MPILDGKLVAEKLQLELGRRSRGCGASTAWRRGWP